MKAGNLYRAAKRNEARARRLVWRDLPLQGARAKRTGKFTAIRVIPVATGSPFAQPIIRRAKDLKAIRKARGITRSEHDRIRAGDGFAL